jgi:DNA-binding NtrC family response regulator
MHLVAKRPVALVIEDERLILMDALDIVTDAGYEATGAASAEEAIRILASRSDIGVIFTDVTLPGSMDGLQLIHAVRRRWPAIQFIVTSGCRIVDESQLLLGSWFFKKPYHPAQIGRALGELAA